jgi:hypothetical protein
MMNLAQQDDITEEDVEITKLIFKYARQFIELTDPDFFLMQDHAFTLMEQRILNHLNKQVRN